jgi:hypothetical protein
MLERLVGGALGAGLLERQIQTADSRIGQLRLPQGRVSWTLGLEQGRLEGFLHLVHGGKTLEALGDAAVRSSRMPGTNRLPTEYYGS